MDNNLIITLLISALSAVSLFGFFYKMKNGFGPFNLKVYGLTVVISVAALLVLSDISSDRLTAAFSLLSAIAGYLFGLKKEKEDTSLKD